MTEMYTCAICGTPYKSVEERAQCESKCVADRKHAEDAAKRNAKRHSEQAIEKELSNVNEMIAKHFHEYDTLAINKHYPYLNYVFKNSTWWS